MFDWMPIEKGAASIDQPFEKQLDPQGMFLLRRGFGKLPEILALSQQVESSSEIPPEMLAKADEAPFFYNNVNGMACLIVKP